MKIMNARKSKNARTKRSAALPASLLAVAIGLVGCNVSQTQPPTAQTPQTQSLPAPAATSQSADAIEEIVVTGTLKRDAAVQYESHPKVRAHSAIQQPSFQQPPFRQPPFHQPPSSERYPELSDNGVSLVADKPVSTFSIDVDSAAYANARRQLNGGQMPVADAVRVEEFINYFNYSYPQPDSNQPFSITTEVGPSPWNADRQLLLVGLQGVDNAPADLPPANLVFLIDVSGSMQSPTKLGLLKSSMKMLTRQLRPEDTISIAVYAGAAGTVLEPTDGSDQAKIMRAIDELRAGGSTNGDAGIKLAYSLAQSSFNDKGINRVLLATDGDFNVGVSSPKALGKLIEKKRKSGIALTVLGFGAGNYNDALMQELAQKGNGNAAYIDTIHEARKVLVDEMGSTLETIAKDVKIQVEFNPATVREYRLIGYETRALAREDFNNDAVDAGEIGAGHSVTALYELTLTGARRPSVDELRYADAQGSIQYQAQHSGELAHVKLRYKAPNGDTSKLVSRVVNARDVQPRIDATSENYRFAAAVSAFGQQLRGNPHTRDFSYADTLQLARGSRGSDAHGYRSEFEKLLQSAAHLAEVENTSNAVSLR